jgi:hypothetical protein
MRDSVQFYRIEEEYEWAKWASEIPYIKFPSSWEIKVIPPFGRAVSRFLVKKGNASVSVYLDCYNALGSYGSPYWEIYPHDDDVYRCGMKEVGSLLKAIKESIKQQNETRDN